MNSWPRHLENVRVQRCSDCGTVAPILGHWGPRQERRLCMRCDNVAWQALLDDAGRIWVTASGQVLRFA